MDWKSFAVGAASGIGSAVAFVLGLGIYALFELAESEARMSDESADYLRKGHE
jgi:hypothetical protein